VSQTSSAARAGLPQAMQPQTGQPPAGQQLAGQQLAGQQHAGQSGLVGQSGPAGTGAGQHPAAHAVRTFFAGTPGRLRAALILTAAVAVLFGLAAAQGFRQADGALERADANTAQLVRLQAIQTNLVSANADATNAFLVGGLEPPAQRQRFTDSMNAAAGLIAEAARAQPADTQALAALNKTLLTYQGLVEQARANNRQGLPVGTQYLRNASAGLRADAVPVLTALVAANEDRVGQEFDGISDGSTWLIGAGLATLVVFAAVLTWLARRTHRYLNMPLVAAAAVVALTMGIGGSALSGAADGAQETRDDSYARTLALSRARIAAYEAKSNESLTLIARGSGAVFEKDWATAVRDGRPAAARGGRRRGRREPVVRAVDRVQADPPGDPEGGRPGQLGGRRRPGHRRGRELLQQGLRELRPGDPHQPGAGRFRHPAGAAGRRRILAAARVARSAARPRRGAAGLVGAVPATRGVPMNQLAVFRPRRRSAPARRAGLVAALAVVVLATGCSSGDYTATPLPTTPAPAPSTQAPAPPAPNCGNPVASYAPAGPLPGPDALPPDSLMAAIKARGRLIAGVSADSLQLGARNPVSGQIEGFDIDMLKAVSTAIFGRPDRIEFRVISSSQRIPVLQERTVDIVARNMTITCGRWRDIAFSTEYYHAGQKLLVQRGSTATGLESLAGKRACAPAASTNLENLRKFPKITAVAADTHTGCLVLFQEGKVDAIAGDDTVLAGLAAQDPYAQVVKAAAYSDEPYGLGMSQQHPEFVQFVNGVLEQMRTDGRWKAAYDRWLAADLGPAPAPPKAVYGRAVPRR
jgi:ABC-type amino acid transport substrate-binding protein